MDELLKILNELHPEVDFTSEQNLIDDGILDSFDIVTLISEIYDTMGVSIDAMDIVPENFNSAGSILALINKQ